VFVSALLAVLSGRTALGYALEGQSWANATTTFSYAIPGNNGIWASALQQALADWTSVTPFTFFGLNQYADPCNDSSPNGADFGTTDCGMAFGSGTLAITTYSSDENNQFIRASTVFNSNVAFSVYTGPLQNSSTDFRRVAANEMGHALGMAHENDSSIPALMAPLVSNIEQPTADDIAGVDALYDSVAKPVSLASAVLPSSRSVQVGATATAFATMVNFGTQTGSSCEIDLPGTMPASFTYQTTNPATNQLTGTANQPIDIAAGASQSFVIAVTPTAAFGSTDAPFTMTCTNASPAPSSSGLNTLLLSASTTPTPDVVTLTATTLNDG